MIYRLNGMIDDFLTLENIEIGVVKPSYTYFKISDLKESILGQVGNILSESKDGDLTGKLTKVKKVLK